MQKTKVEILDETVEFYTNNPRSLGLQKGYDGYGCLYNGPNDTHCAFARMCIDPSKLKEIAAASSNLKAFGHEILKEEYRGYDATFYDEMQHIHDNNALWLVHEPGSPGKGLTEAGERKIQKYRKAYEQGTSTGEF